MKKIRASSRRACASELASRSGSACSRLACARRASGGEIGRRGGEVAESSPARVGGELRGAGEQRGRCRRSRHGFGIDSRLTSSSAATSSSGACAAAARCQARRSGSCLDVGRGRERTVRLSALGIAGAVVDRRADQRVPKADRWAGTDEVFGFGGQDRALVEVEVASGPPHERGVSGRLGRGDEQKPLRLGGQLSDLTQKSRFEVRRRPAARAASRRPPVGRSTARWSARSVRAGCRARPRESDRGRCSRPAARPLTPGGRPTRARRVAGW